MAIAVAAVASFFTAATTAVVSAIGFSAATAAAAGAAVGGFVSALGFASGVGAGLQAWATVGAFATLLGSRKVPNLQSSGLQLDMKTGNNLPVPIAFGRTGTGGTLVYRRTWESNLNDRPNETLGMINVLSGGGPCEIENTYKDNYLVNWDVDPKTGLAAAQTLSPFNSGSRLFRHVMKEVWRYGWQPEDVNPKTYTGNYGGSNGWPGMTSNSKFSGLCHVAMVYDWVPESFPQGLPQKSIWVVKGIRCYDPRLDSTFTGGSGGHRANNPASYSFTENPAIIALNWIMGRLEGAAYDKRTWGMNLPLEAVDVNSFVNAANLCDLYGWKCGGVVDTDDDKHDVLAKILQAASAEAVFTGKDIKCVMNAPRTSVFTIKTEHVLDIEITASPSLKDRKNRVVPYYREESQAWEIVAANAVTSSVYVTEDDGLTLTTEIEYSHCQNPSQAVKLAAYDLVNGRELLEYRLTCVPALLQVEIGDAVNVMVDQIASSNQKCLVVGRKIDHATGLVSLTLRSETDAKHDFALGKTAVAPPSAALSYYDATMMTAPDSELWSITATSLSDEGDAVEITQFEIADLQVAGHDTGDSGEMRLPLAVTKDGLHMLWLVGEGETNDMIITNTESGSMVDQRGGINSVYDDYLANGGDTSHTFDKAIRAVSIPNSDDVLTGFRTPAISGYYYYHFITYGFSFGEFIYSQHITKRVPIADEDMFLALYTKPVAAGYGIDPYGTGGIGPCYHVVFESGICLNLPLTFDDQLDTDDSIISKKTLAGFENVLNPNSTYFDANADDYAVGGFIIGNNAGDESRFYVYVNEARVRWYNDNAVSGLKNSFIQDYAPYYTTGFMMSWTITEDNATPIVRNYEFGNPPDNFMPIRDEALDQNGDYQVTTGSVDAFQYSERISIAPVQAGNTSGENYVFFHKDIQDSSTHTGGTKAQLLVFKLDPQTWTFSYHSTVSDLIMSNPPSDWVSDVNAELHLYKRGTAFFVADSPSANKFACYQAYAGEYDRTILVSVRFAWETQSIIGGGSTGISTPALVVSGTSADNPRADRIVFAYRKEGATVWTPAGTVPASPVDYIDYAITSISGGGNYEVGVSYMDSGSGLQTPWLVLGPVSVNAPYIPIGGVDLGGGIGGGDVIVEDEPLPVILDPVINPTYEEYSGDSGLTIDANEETQFFWQGDRAAQSNVKLVINVTLDAAITGKAILRLYINGDLKATSNILVQGGYGDLDYSISTTLNGRPKPPFIYDTRATIEVPDVGTAVTVISSRISYAS